MTDRSTMTKTKRFEIFKRDYFTCQYCGQRPPNVVLEVDHIEPRSKGGSNDDINLITSCFDCNRGKKDTLLGDRIIRPDADLAFLQVQQELAESKRYLDASRLSEEAQKKVIERLQEVWHNCLGGDKVPGDLIIRGWLQKFSPEMIEDGIYKTVPVVAAEKISPWALRRLISYTFAVMRNMEINSDTSGGGG